MAISFIDGGQVQGSFAWCLSDSLVQLKNRIDITHILRTRGPNLPQNRYDILQRFALETDADWLLCIDSDIVFTADQIELLWETKSEQRQVVSGVYFLLTRPTNIVPVPMPAIFKPLTTQENGLDGLREYWHPLPNNQVVEIGAGGFGFLLISRGVVEKILKTYTDNPFDEKHTGNNKYIGEDFAFFLSLESLGIKSFAHTGIIVYHEKSIQIGYDYYAYFYKELAPRARLLHE